MNPKFIFLDIDGTLVSAMQPPSRQVAAAVRGARANGHKGFLHRQEYANYWAGYFRYRV